jgi:glycosyltransferase involved in cell wall biosynthesis
LTRIHRRRRFDVIYSNTINNGLGPILRTLWRVPNVLHVHECPTQRPAFLRAVLLLAERTSDRVVFNSDYTRSLVGEYQPRLSKRGVVVHIGIDLPQPLAPGAEAERLRVCCPARIHPKKGQSDLVQAVGRAAAEGRCWDVHLYGDTLAEHEPIRAALEREITALGLEHQFHWHGFVQDPEILYRDTDVCVVPSVVPEEFSMVCLEAQAFGLPVIATGPGGPSEIIVAGETGLIVPPTDAAALAAALTRLDDDARLRRQMGERGRERVRTRFSRAAYGRRITAICEEALPPGYGEWAMTAAGSPEGG